MRVIAGEFKGRRLVTPRGRRTRPTADQVRLALMDTLGPWLPRARVLDLYAGARFTIIFLDPPYEDAIDAALEGVARAGLAAADGIVIAQHRTKRPPAAS